MSETKPQTAGYLDPLLLRKLAEIRESSLLRATGLRKHAQPTTQSELLWMTLALQELDVAHEELRVVEEELHKQADALSTAHAVIELERERYRQLFLFAPEPYLVTDLNGVVLEANLRATQLLRHEPQFLAGKPLTLYIGEEDRTLMRNVLTLLAENSEVSSFELRILPRHATRPIWTSASVWRTPTEGKPSGVLQWILHQHRPQRDEQSNEAARTQLERDLARERVSRVDAEQALEQRNAVMAFVAHELRNPLNSTAGWLEILNHEDPSLTAHPQALSVLARNVKTLARMVDELVDQTRIVQGLVKLDCESIELRELLERVCEDARGMAQSKQQHFSHELADDLGRVRCDAFRVQQVLINVIGNALKFTPRAGSVQFLALRRDDWVECVVRDNGPGIAAENLSTIFEPFVRVDAHTTSTGLGLGLNIARKLIELHGGSIAAESDGLGCGATFRVHLPIAGPRGA